MSTKAIEVIQLDYNSWESEVTQKSIGLFTGEHPVDRKKALDCINMAIREYKYDYDFDVLGNVYPRWFIKTRFID